MLWKGEAVHRGSERVKAVIPGCVQAYIPFGGQRACAGLPIEGVKSAAFVVVVPARG